MQAMLVRRVVADFDVKASTRAIGTHDVGEGTRLLCFLINGNNFFFLFFHFEFKTSMRNNYIIETEKG